MKQKHKCISVLHFGCCNQRKGRSCALINAHMVDIFYFFFFVSGCEVFFIILISGCHATRELFESDSTVIFPWFVSGVAWCKSAGSMHTFSHFHLLVQSWIFLINSYKNKILESGCFPQHKTLLPISGEFVIKETDIFLSVNQVRRPCHSSSG